MNKLAGPMKVAAMMVGALTLLSGCAINMAVPITDPVPSAVGHTPVSAPAPVTLVFKDDQSDADKKDILAGSLIPMQLTYKDKPFEGVSWVADHTVRELKARGLPVVLGTDASSGSVVSIKRLHIQNSRASGFSPFITFTSVRADLITPRGPQRITAYIKRAKVPVVSFNEVIDPTYNEPLGLVTKELAAKINQQLFGQVLSNDKVQALVAAINKDATTRADAYHDVYQLGFSNNPAAVPELVKLASHGSEYVRLAAISSLGIIKAVDQYPFLVRRYEDNTGVWQDRAMALKAIGDLGTADSKAYLKAEALRLDKLTDKGSAWTKEIVSLYLADL